MTAIVDLNAASAETLQAAIGPDSTVLSSLADVPGHLDGHPSETVVLIAQSVNVQAALDLAADLRIQRPHVGVILIRQRVDAQLLAAAMRGGVRDVVSDRDLAAVSDAVRRAKQVATQIREGAGTDAGSEGPRGRVVTVFASKGGCGKTTVSTNLAATLADGGRRQVCILDLDLAFGDVSVALQLFPAHTIIDAVALQDTLDASGVRSLLTEHSAGLCALSAPVEPGLAESISASLITDLISLLRTMFDFVIIDSPPAFTDHVLAAFDQSDVIALLATLDIPAVKNLKLSMETLEMLNYPRDRWRVVLNRADSKVGLSIAEVEKTLKVGINAEIPSSRAVPASINRGVPIVLDEPKHPVSLAIRRFGEDHVLPLSAGNIPDSLRQDRRTFLRRKARNT